MFYKNKGGINLFKFIGFVFGGIFWVEGVGCFWIKGFGWIVKCLKVKVIYKSLLGGEVLKNFGK